MTYDRSSKLFEVLIIRYSWYKYSRTISSQSKWGHYGYYKTMESALHACRDLRRNTFHRRANEFPGADREKDYPNIIPRITIYRFKAIKRNS